MKNLFLGFAVVAIAFGASAFTSVGINDYVVQKGTTDTYVLEPVSNFNPDNCLSTTVYICAYKILTNETLSFPLSEAEVLDLEKKGKLQEIKGPGGVRIYGEYDDTP